MFHPPPSRPSPKTPDAGKSSPPPTGRDRGPAAFFHGRKAIISSFETALSDTITLNAGTTFLIQGAPGAGKTALLDVLSSRAEEKKWEVSKISIEDLYTPASMAQSLGRSYTVDHEQAAKIGVKFIEGGYVRSVAGHASPKEILKSLAPEEGLILVLDEAQYLINLNETPSEKHVARDTLDVIHNGDVGRPVVLLAAGLGTTESALNSLGISRFVRDCTVGLGALGEESEWAVIRDWLTKDGGAKGDPAPWIHAIAQQTHGWPQHIISYVKSAVAYLKSNNHRMTDDGLQIVLEKGNEFRLDYYETRAREFSLQQRRVIGSFIAKYQPDEYFEKEDLMALLDAKYAPKPASKFFDDLLHSGILHKQDGGVYGIPIPSMQTWLIEEYGRDRMELPRGEVSRVKPESPNRGRDSSKWDMER